MISGHCEVMNYLTRTVPVVHTPPLALPTPRTHQVNDLIANPHSAEAAGGDVSGLQGLMGESVGRTDTEVGVVRVEVGPCWTGTSFVCSTPALARLSLTGLSCW